MRADLDNIFMEHAFIAARRSTCLRMPKGVGCVLVRDNRLLATGYAGSIRGAEHCSDVGCMIDTNTGGCIRTIHAEINAVLNAAYYGIRIEGATAYTTLSPCWDCFKSLSNGGVVRIIYAEEYRRGVLLQREFAESLGIELKLL